MRRERQSKSEYRRAKIAARKLQIFGLVESIKAPTERRQKMRSQIFERRRAIGLGRRSSPRAPGGGTPG